MVPCHGECLLPLKFGSHSFEWSFQFAPVTTPIIGADFLIHFNLLVDMAGKKILNASTLQVIGSKINTAPESIYSTANILSTPDEIKGVLEKFPDVVSSESLTATPPRHATLHHISTTPGPPVFAKARRLDPDKLATAKAEFLKMEKAGIIRRSNSPWSSPLHMSRVQKKGNSSSHFLPLVNSGAHRTSGGSTAMILNLGGFLQQHKPDPIFPNFCLFLKKEFLHD